MIRKVVLVPLIFILVVPLASAAGDVAQRMASILQQFYGPGAAQSQLYVGSEMCIACHAEQEDWRMSLHATAFGEMSTNDTFSLQPRYGAVNDFDGNGVDDFKQGLDFNQISSKFDKYKPNAPILMFDQEKGYRIKVGMVEAEVQIFYGAYWKQRYVVKIPVADRPGGLTAGHYMSPIQYNLATNAYTTYHPEFWWDANNQPIWNLSSTSADVASGHGQNFDKKCTGCHFTGLSIWQDNVGEWRASAAPAVIYRPDDPHYVDYNGDGIKENIITGCEVCHGPGSEHIIGRGAEDKIINPATDLSPQQANMICGGCHTRGKSLPSGTFDYPWDENTGEHYFVNLGEELPGRFWNEKPGLWPDGVEQKKHRQQFIDYRQAEKSQAPHNVACYDCHNVHERTKHHVRSVITVDGMNVPSRVEDNSHCLACHAGEGAFTALSTADILDVEANRVRIAAVVQEHTFHAYSPERSLGLSRCTECHMANLGKSAVAYDISTHNFHGVPPQKTLDTQADGGMPNSCAVRCHSLLAPLFGFPADTNLENWTEASDVQTAEWLKTYYGPNGAWWMTPADGQ